MKYLTVFLLGALLGAGSMFVGQGYHVLRTADGYELVRKVRPGFALTYVDVRNYQAEDWLAHPQLAQAVLEADKGHLIKATAMRSLRQAIEDLTKKLLPEP